MGTLTISMNDDDEKLLREVAIKKFGNTKGAISRTVKEAVVAIATVGKDDKYIEIARKGLSLGKIDMKKIRGDMYGRYKGI